MNSDNIPEEEIYLQREVIKGRTFASFLMWVHDLMSVLGPCRFPIIMLMVGFAALFSAQGQDVVRSFYEAYEQARFQSPERMGEGVFFDMLLIVLFILITGWWGVQLWHGARKLLSLSDVYFHNYTRVLKYVKRVPRILGALAFVLVFLASWRAVMDIENNLSWIRVLSIMGFGLPGLTGLFYYFLMNRRKLFKNSEMTPLVLRRYNPGDSVVTWSFVFISGGVGLLAFLVFLIEPIWFSRVLGTSSVMMLALASWIVLGTMLVYADRATKIPLVLSLIILLVLFSRGNNNHDIYFVGADKEADIHCAPGKGLACEGYSAHFMKWLEENKDALTQGNKKQVPVFLIAAEGGGQRSAYWTAGILSALQDKYPGFYRHVYALSGVSGGSFGTAVFTSFLADTMEEGKEKPSTKLRPLAGELLAVDYLSPITAHLVFPTVLQSLVPFEISGFDRAKTFDRSWERTYDKVLANHKLLKKQGGAFGRSYYDLWSKERRYKIPRLILNTTHVESGKRAVISSLRLERESTRPGGRPVEVSRLLKKQMPLSETASLSARFPYVSPAGRLYAQGQGEEKLWGHLVDGGYFENSGTAALFDIYMNIVKKNDAIKEKFGFQVQIYVITIRNEERPPAGGPKTYKAIASIPHKWEPMVWLNGLLEPPITMLSTRGARASHDVSVMERMARDKEDKNTGSRSIYIANVLDLNMDLSGADVPLGWYLSATARNRADLCVDKYLGKLARGGGDKGKQSVEALTRGLETLGGISCYKSPIK